MTAKDAPSASGPAATRLCRLFRTAGIALLGALAAAGHPPLSLWFITLLSLAAAVALFVTTPPGRAAFRLGWTYGSGYFAATLFWITEPFLVEAAVTGWMAPFALLFMAAGLALFWGAGFWAASFFGPPRSVRLAAFVATFGLAELARAYVLTGFPWGLVGYVWYGTPPMQLAALFGVHGLGALMLLIVVLPFAFAGRAVGVVLAVSLAVASWSLGAALGSSPVPAPTDPVRLRLIQPNAEQARKWDPEFAPGFLKRQIAYSRAPAARPPDLVIWPEAAVTFWLGDKPRIQTEIADAAAPGRVIMGIRRHAEGRYYNSLALLGGDGQPNYLYDKRHLVPFGEYVPLGAALARFGIHGLAASEGTGFSRGQNARLLDLGPQGRVLPLICYEALFPELLLRPGPRPDWILQITNDAWYGRIAGPQQHLAIAAFRAVEQGLPLVRVANTGISAVIDPHGRMTASLGLGEAGFLDAALPGALPRPIYAKTGDWPIAVLLAVVLGALLTMGLRN